jgi:hypothetical protein
MSLPETGDYISHHLKMAGRVDTLFSADAVNLIHNASRALGCACCSGRSLTAAGEVDRGPGGCCSSRVSGVPTVGHRAWLLPGWPLGVGLAMPLGPGDGVAGLG